MRLPYPIVFKSSNSHKGSDPLYYAAAAIQS